MQIEARNIDDIVILDLNGRLAAGVSDEMLPQAMEILLNDGYRRVILNLSMVDYIDSMGLGDIVHACRTAQQRGAIVKLVNPQDRVRKTLELTKVTTIFELHENEIDAVNSFNENAEAREAGHA